MYLHGISRLDGPMVGCFLTVQEHTSLLNFCSPFTSLYMLADLLVLAKFFILSSQPLICTLSFLFLSLLGPFRDNNYKGLFSGKQKVSVIINTSMSNTGFHSCQISFFPMHTFHSPLPTHTTAE